MKRQEKAPVEDVSMKEEFKQQFNKKKQTQQSAKERRQFLRELKEERDWK
jgi:hypothetical protein